MSKPQDVYKWPPEVVTSVRKERTGRNRFHGTEEGIALPLRMAQLSTPDTVLLSVVPKAPVRHQPHSVPQRQHKQLRPSEPLAWAPRSFLPSLGVAEGLLCAGQTTPFKPGLTPEGPSL